VTYISSCTTIAPHFPTSIPFRLPFRTPTHSHFRGQHGYHCSRSCGAQSACSMRIVCSSLDIFLTKHSHHFSCGASEGTSPVHMAAARELAHAMHKANAKLVRGPQSFYPIQAYSTHLQLHFHEDTLLFRCHAAPLSCCLVIP
jgi:hypothetical protein